MVLLLVPSIAHAPASPDHGPPRRRIGARAVVLAAVAWTAACVGPIARPPRAGGAAPRRQDALLVLPGFGYGRAGARALRALQEPMAREGIDLYVPAYVSRRGLDRSRDNVRRFVAEQGLDRYERLHVFAFIAGAWTLNPLAEAGELPNLATVVYDRSPYQERAPRIADEKLHFLAWLRYGRPVFDVARTPYPPLTSPSVRTALVIETRRTRLLRVFARTADGYGPYHFECDAFGQRLLDDCMYVPVNHDELYVRFAEVWPEVLAFIRGARFTDDAERRPP